MRGVDKGRFQTYPALGIFLFLLLLVFWPLTFGHFSVSNLQQPKHSLLSHNVWNEFLPLYQYAFERLHRGELPLWNPYQACGVPVLAALQSGIFYPPNWLYCFVNIYTGLKWLSILHLFWAGLWTALLYRKLFSNSNSFASLLASAGFVLSGFLPHQVWWPGNLYAASWLPCLIFLGEHLIQRRSWCSAVAVAIGVTLALLAGFTQFTVYTYFLLCGFMLFRMCQIYLFPGHFHEFLAVSLLSISAVTMALLLASPQLLPTIELLQLSGRRPGNLSSMTSQIFGVEMYSFKNMLQGLFRYDFSGNYVAFVIMLGVPISFVDRNNRRLVTFFLLTALAALFLSLGTNTFLYALYFNHIPTGNWFTTPSRWRLISLFCICMIGSRGINILIDEFFDGVSGSRLKTHSIWLFLATGFILLWVGNYYSGEAFQLKPPGTISLISPPLFFLLQSIALMIGILVAYHSHFSANMVRFIIVFVILIEGILAHRYSEPFPYPAYAPYNLQAVRFLTEHVGTQRVHLENNDLEARVFAEKAASIFKFYGTTDWEPLTLRRYGDFIRTMSDGSHVRGESYGHFQISHQKVLFPLFNLLSPKFIVISDGAQDLFQLPEKLRPFVWPDAFPRANFPLVAEFNGVKVYENPFCLPRAIFSSSFTVCDDDTQALNLLRMRWSNPTYNPIIDAIPEGLSDDLHRKHPGTARKVEIEALKDERIECEADVERGGILWTTDAYYPGWKVKVNGKASRLLKVNSFFRGVAIPGGTSHVEFYYECRPLRMGLVLFVAALFIILLGFVVERRLRDTSGRLFHRPIP